MAGDVEACQKLIAGCLGSLLGTAWQEARAPDEVVLPAAVKRILQLRREEDGETVTSVLTAVSNRWAGTCKSGSVPFLRRMTKVMTTSAGRCVSKSL